MLWGIFRKGMMPVLKIRLQGTKKELRWLLKGMERDSRYEVEDISTFKPCDGACLLTNQDGSDKIRQGEMRRFKVWRTVGACSGMEE